MSWGELLASVLIFSTFHFAYYSADRHKLWGSLFNTHEYILNALVAITLSFNIVALVELIRGGRRLRKDRRILGVFYFIFIVACSFILFITDWRGGLEIQFCGVIALLAAPFPCVRYLNLRQSQRASQPVVTSAP